MTHKPPTLRQLAKELNLALSTVSLALTDRAGVSKATRCRVRAAAEKIGYVPDPRISSVMGFLKRKKADRPTAAMAYVSSYSSEIVLRDHPVYYNYFRGASEKAEQLGYRLEGFNLEEEGLSGPRLEAILKSRGIEGIVIPPLFKGAQTFDLDLNQFATVTFGFSFAHDRIRRVTLDHFLGTMAALERIAEKGYRRVGFIFGPNANARMQYRWVAALYAFLAKRRDQARIEPYEDELSGGGVADWFRQNEPDAIVSMRMDWAPCLFEADLHCGKDFGFAHLEHESVAVHCALLKDESLAAEYRKAAGLDQNSFYTGGHAVELLAADLAANAKGLLKHPSVTLIEGEWRDGATLPPRSALRRPGASR